MTSNTQGISFTSSDRIKQLNEIDKVIPWQPVIRLLIGLVAKTNLRMLPNCFIPQD